jgi:hypothetical protein
MNLLKLVQSFKKATEYRARLAIATKRLSRQMNWEIDPTLEPEQQTLNLLKRLSALAAIHNVPQVKKKLPNLDSLNLKKYPLKQKTEIQMPLLPSESTSLKANDLN